MTFLCSSVAIGRWQNARAHDVAEHEAAIDRTHDAFRSVVVVTAREAHARAVHALGGGVGAAAAVVVTWHAVDAHCADTRRFARRDAV